MGKSTMTKWTFSIANCKGLPEGMTRNDQLEVFDHMGHRLSELVFLKTL